MDTTELRARAERSPEGDPHELFARAVQRARSARRTRPSRVALAAAAVVLVVVGWVGFAVLGDNSDEDQLATGEPDPTSTQPTATDTEPAPVVGGSAFYTRVGDALVRVDPDGSTATVAETLRATDRFELAAARRVVAHTASADECGHEIVLIGPGGDRNVFASDRVAPAFDPTGASLALVVEQGCEPSDLVEVHLLRFNDVITLDVNPDDDGLPMQTLDVAWASPDRLLVLLRSGEGNQWTYFIAEYDLTEGEEGTELDYQRQLLAPSDVTWSHVASSQNRIFAVSTADDRPRLVEVAESGDHLTAPVEERELADLDAEQVHDLAVDNETGEPAVSFTTPNGQNRLLSVTAGGQMAWPMAGLGLAYDNRP
jgi:hypothetical protein